MNEKRPCRQRFATAVLDPERTSGLSIRSAGYTGNIGAAPLACCGFHVASLDRAIVWADTELYAERMPSGHRCKIAVNALACIVGAGTGYVELLRCAEEIVAESKSFDAAIAELPRRLNRTAHELEAHGIAALSSTTILQTYFCTGWSHRLGRIVGAVFRAGNEFAAAIAMSFAAPSAAVRVTDEQSCIAAVQQQMVRLQAQNPRAGAGVLVTATVTPASITAGPIFDLSRGAGLRRVVDLDEGASVRAPVQQSHPVQSVVTAENAESSCGA